MSRLRSAAAERSLPISSVVEQLAAGTKIYPTRTRAATDARTYAAIGYRITRAIAALEAADESEVRAHLDAMRGEVVRELTEIREGYDAELDATKTESAWVSVDEPFRGRGLPKE